MMKKLLNICLCVCALAFVACVSDGKVDENNANNTPSEDKGVLLLNVGTRTTDGIERDYVLSIYKNEAGKATLVRKYDSSKENMQKPEYIWLLEGNYTAKVESGAVVAATFNDADKVAEMQAAIDAAVAEAEEKGIHGKETTPFLLAKIKDITGGDSLDSNIQLVFNNARLAAKVACEMVK